MANFKQTMRNMVGSALPPRLMGQKVGVTAPGALARMHGRLPASPAMLATSAFTVQDAPTSYRTYGVPVRSWLSGIVEDKGTIAGLGAGGFMDGQTLGVPNKYLVYGGIAAVTLGGVAFFMRRRRAQASVAGFGYSRRRRTTKRRRK